MGLQEGWRGGGEGNVASGTLSSLSLRVSLRVTDYRVRDRALAGCIPGVQGAFKGRIARQNGIAKGARELPPGMGLEHRGHWGVSGTL